MKAAIIREHGSADKLEIADVDKPTYGPNEVLINVKAFALNRLDIWTREGLPSLDLDFPHIGGSDFSGIISETGKNVSNVQIGDRVVVNPGISCMKCRQCRNGEQSLCKDFHLLGEHVWGGAAEYARVPSQNLIKLPDNIKFEDAAAIALTALTSYRMLKSRANINPGDLVLITGSGGGIGTVATQIACHFGGRVLALTSSEEKEDLARELGAENTFNYKNNEEWSKSVWKYTDKQGVDIVVDSAGEKVFSDAIRCLSKGGKYVTCGATTGTNGNFNIARLFWKQLSILGSTMSNHQEFSEVMQLFFKGDIKPIIDSVYDFDEIAIAHRRLENPDHMGKIVVKM